MVKFDGHRSPVYITSPDSPPELFPGLEAELVASNLESGLLEHINKIAKSGKIILHPFVHQSLKQAPKEYFHGYILHS